MAEEIKFFGNKNINTEFVFSDAARSQLNEFGVSIPATCVLTCEEIKSIDPLLFPWPVVVGGDFPPRFIQSLDDLMDLVDGMRSQDHAVSIRLPPQGSNIKYLKHVCAYVGIDFICIHNTDTDLGIVLNVFNHKFFDRANLPVDKVVRLISGYYGWYVEEIISKSDERLQPIWSLKLSNIPEHFQPFKKGYQVGFAIGHNHTFKSVNNDYSPNSNIGDPYTFGILFGSHVKKAIGDILPQVVLPNINKATLTMAKAMLEQNQYQRAIGLINIHNEIQSGISNEFVKKVCAIMKPDCKGVIPNSLIVCGEGGNYCSDTCLEQATIGKKMFKDTLVAGASLLNIALENSQNHYDNLIINTPDDSEINFEVSLKSSVMQYRVMNGGEENISIRLQLANCELSYKMITQKDTAVVIPWASNSKPEIDLHLYKDKIDNPELWPEWSNKIINQKFENKSTFGSENYYASLSYQINKGFCLEDGFVVIPQHIFLRKLKDLGYLKLELLTEAN